MSIRLKLLLEVARERFPGSAIELSFVCFFQYHGESFLGQATSSSGPWHSTTSTASLTSRSSSTFVDTGLSPPPSSNNSNVDDHPQQQQQQQQQPLKPLHINNNIPSSYPTSTGSTSSNHLATNTPTPPSSAEAISPSSVSSGKEIARARAYGS